MKKIPTMQVSDLIEQLAGLPKDAEISFSGLTFERIKGRGKNYQIEFREGPYLSKDGVLKVAVPSDDY